MLHVLISEINLRTILHQTVCKIICVAPQIAHTFLTDSLIGEFHEFTAAGCYSHTFVKHIQPALLGLTPMNETSKSYLLFPSFTMIPINSEPRAKQKTWPVKTFIALLHNLSGQQWCFLWRHHKAPILLTACTTKKLTRSLCLMDSARFYLQRSPNGHSHKNPFPSNQT